MHQYAIVIMDEEKLSSFNETIDTKTSFSQLHLEVIVPLTVNYVIIFVTGIFGNIITCIVISCNRSMYSDTNLLILSLAISDLLLLICELPLQLYRLWNPFSYPLTQRLCKIVGLVSETSANSIVLTITAFTVERYIAICRPFMWHKTSKLSRAVRYIIVVWACALFSAVPQVLQFEIVTYKENGQIINACTVKRRGVLQLFAVFRFMFFIVLVSIIIVLYGLICVKLQTSRVLHPFKKSSVENGNRSDGTQRYRNGASQRKVIRMLGAVALSFFLCMTPFHIQRLIAIYGTNLEHPTDTYYKFYVVMTYLSGVLYFLSTSINTVLYSIMSNKFRNAYKAMLCLWCTPRDRYWFENDVLSERRERAAAMALQRTRNPRILRPFTTASSQQCVAPPRAQVTSRKKKTYSDLLAEERERAVKRALQHSRYKRMLRHFAIASAQQSVAQPGAQSLKLSNLTLMTEESESWL